MSCLVVADVKDELKELRRQVRASIRPSGPVALLAFSIALLLAACSGAEHTGTPAPTPSGGTGVTDPTPGRTEGAAPPEPTPVGAPPTPDAEAQGRARDRERWWGDGAWEGTGDFLSVGVGGGFACGLRADGAIECWGGILHVDVDITPPEGEFVSLSVGRLHACAIRPTDHVVCWGSDDQGQAAVVDYVEIPTFHSVNAGGVNSCGFLKRSGNSLDWSLFCWGRDFWKVEQIGEAEEFVSVIAGGDHVCAVRPDRTLACWGGEGEGWIDAGHTGDSYRIPPEGMFDSISLGDDYGCGVRTGGAVECWGNDYGDRIGSTPQGEFRSVSVGDEYVCGIRTNGSIDCWGRYPVPPFGAFASVSAGFSWGLTCGIRPAGGVLCWDSSGPKEGPPWPP